MTLTSINDMASINQEQKPGECSQNLQAGHDINIITGLTYAETKDIVRTEAQKVFKENSLVLADEAYKLVLSRSEELLDSFLKKLENKNPNAIGSMRDPGMQYSLYTAQKEYAKTGDKNLADLLEDILVQRAENTTRDLMQIVLDECISVIPKLTADQFDALSLIFILRYSINNSVTNLENLIIYIIQSILPFKEGIREELSRYQHLEFTSCGTLGISSINIEQIIRNNYLVVFSKGFTIEEFENAVGTDPKYKMFIAPCQNNTVKYQINIINLQQVEIIGSKNGLNYDEIQKIKSIFNKFSMDENDVRTFLIKRFPQVQECIESWGKSSIKFMTLTSVGIAIGHANIVRKTKQEDYDLRIWIK